MFRSIAWSILRGSSSSISHHALVYRPVRFLKSELALVNDSTLHLHLSKARQTMMHTKEYSTNRPSSNPPHDEIVQMLNQMSSEEDFDANVENFEGADFDELDADTANALPGHRIRGILIPTKETHAAMIGEQRYDELPIAHVFASNQNTHITITEHTGAKYYSRSTGGLVGFKNAKKKTAIAAQTAAYTAGQLAVKKGVTHVRVSFNGIGKGRIAACKGLEEAGITIVSLTDVSKVDFGTNMPRKRRRI